MKNFSKNLSKKCNHSEITLKKNQLFNLRKICIRILKYKNLWRRKSVRRGIFRNAEVKVEGDEAPASTLTLFATRPPSVSLCDLGHLTPKMNIAFFIRNLMLNIFLFDNFFEKSCIFRKKPQKTVLGEHLITL